MGSISKGHTCAQQGVGHAVIALSLPKALGAGWYHLPAAAASGAPSAIATGCEAICSGER